MFSSCYTQLSRSITNDSTQLTDINDDSVFLPDSNFSIDGSKISNLFNDWIRSREEEKEDEQIYRPKNFKKFPPSRYRQTYNFLFDGKSKYLMLSPDDRHYQISARWRLLKENPNILLFYDEKAQVIRKITIESLSQNLLKIIYTY